MFICSTSSKSLNSRVKVIQVSAKILHICNCYIFQVHAAALLNRVLNQRKHLFTSIVCLHWLTVTALISTPCKDRSTLSLAATLLLWFHCAKVYHGEHKHCINSSINVAMHTRSCMFSCCSSLTVAQQLYEFQLQSHIVATIASF
jgi:hypothetical protein